MRNGEPVILLILNQHLRCFEDMNFRASFRKGRTFCKLQEFLLMMLLTHQCIEEWQKILIFIETRKDVGHATNC